MFTSDSWNFAIVALIGMAIVLYYLNLTFPELELINISKQRVNKFDYIICLGGDGTILHLIKYLGSKCLKSKVFAFNFGKVGFIAPF